MIVLIRRAAMTGSPTTSRRPGAVLAAVLAALVVALAICGALLQTAVAERQQLRVIERRAQAVWLAESGLERAAARLAADTAYRGERWAISAGELGGPHGAIVEIEVRDAKEDAKWRSVQATAVYPDQGDLMARKSKQALVRLENNAGVDP
jgi:type II secretory pathway component PulK